MLTIIDMPLLFVYPFGPHCPRLKSGRLSIKLKVYFSSFLIVYSPLG